MRTLLMTFTTVLAASCASQPQAKPVEIDPSNPAAAEAPRATVPELGRPEPSTPPAAAPTTAPAPAAPAHDHAAHGGAAAPSKAKAVYTCPMHPEVVSDGPGRCPKCGMNLVKKSDGAAPDERK